MKLDAYDIKILVALQQNGRMTKLRLAEEINLSPSPCWERLKRLEESGIIKGYHAEVDVDRLIRCTNVLVEVTLKSHHANDFKRFEDAVRDVPEVVDCYATGGGFDYLLRMVTLDIDHYQRLIDRLLEADIGIERYFTYIVTKRVKLADGYPIRHLLELQEQAAAEQP